MMRKRDVIAYKARQEALGYLFSLGGGQIVPTYDKRPLHVGHWLIGPNPRSLSQRHDNLEEVLLKGEQGVRFCFHPKIIERITRAQGWTLSDLVCQGVLSRNTWKKVFNGIPVPANSIIKAARTIASIDPKPWDIPASIFFMEGDPYREMREYVASKIQEESLELMHRYRISCEPQAA